MKSPIALLRDLWVDIQRLDPDVKGLNRDFHTIEQRFEHEGYGFLTIALPSLDDALLLGLSSGRFTCPSGFKMIRGGTIPRFLSGMFCEVFDPFSGVLKQSLDEGVLKSLHQILRLFKKTQLSSDEEITLHEKAVSEFFRCDDQARQVILPDLLSHLIGCVSKVILFDLSSKSTSEFTFKHGPGAVEEGLKANQKWSALSNSIKNEEFDLDAYGYADYSVCLSDLSERAVANDSMRPIDPFSGVSRSTARLITVAKNSTSRRTITVEPLLNQFIQQGLNIALRDSIVACPILSGCLALTDQSKNQTLALEGSLYDNWATIDLKSASDLMSVSLVKTVFGHHAWFYKHMMACRSTSVKSGSLTASDLGKFAGMGNALTFPAQSICFAVVCIAAILHQNQEYGSYWQIKRASRHIRVYGDDIIIDTRYAHQCVNWLHDAGLKVNVKKSFLQGNFKESCGVEAYKGVDITPLYIRHRPDQTSTEPSVIGHLVALSNQAWLCGYYKFSTCLRNEVEERLGYSLPLVSRESGSLGWHSRQDAMTPHKWCKRTHQFLTRTAVLISLKRKDKLDGYAALLKFFHVPLLGRARNHLNESSIRYKLRIVLKWVPTLSRDGLNLQV
ncbi:RNA-directed RNA polymerase [ssRNA phage Gerhypos.1_12]|uniref:RNA-directed RNA polymerase n=2 Tax=Leviviricetes TaxID=2842243 RepID=A0A8S5KYP2_9VIRU|nr:RNA-directed RNA polymerase [ssRNA phage Gerhypos.1_12]QDH89979.1 MAG: RNA-dependent RNA polymerase [Leviviridae sp.]DAD50537.1 TPA_asm: RNA-directed RNA polymerase [ssRNA phage Gerhypos.1_12]